MRCGCARHGLRTDPCSIWKCAETVLNLGYCMRCKSATRPNNKTTKASVPSGLRGDGGAESRRVHRPAFILACDTSKRIHITSINIAPSAVNTCTKATFCIQNTVERRCRTPGKFLGEQAVLFRLPRLPCGGYGLPYPPSALRFSPSGKAFRAR